MCFILLVLFIHVHAMPCSSHLAWEKEWTCQSLEPVSNGNLKIRKENLCC